MLIFTDVGEWCRTPWQEDYQDYKNEPKVGDEDTSRVLRGGAFDDDRTGVRCSYRFRDSPLTRDYLMGFRVSLSPFL